MTAWIGVAIFFGLILIVGLGATLVLQRHHPGWRPWEAGAHVWGLGTGLVTWLLFMPSTLGWPVPLTGIVWLALPAGILVIGMARKRKSIAKGPRRSGVPPLRTLDVTLTAIIVILLLSSAVSAVSLPLQRFDAITHFGLKAKVLLEEQDFSAEAFTDPSRVHFHRTYPPLVPLLEASVSARIGWHDEHKIKIIFPAFYAALLCLVYGAQRSFASRTHSLLFTALLASAPLVSSDSAGGAASGLADLPFAFFATASALATSRGIASGRAMDGILGGLMAGFAVCTKQEGSILIAVIGVSLFVHLGLSARRGEWAKALPCVMAWACAVMVIALPWWVVRAGPSRSDVGGIGWYLSQLHPERLTLLPSRILPLA
ncbi:MAG: glycosyltransferase family 39 protein, partial [Planctomycetota bacterium]|nr:glycosyltransferase family 39 protein [Planctomycetota bacterium]